MIEPTHPTKSDPVSFRLTPFEERMISDLKLYFNESRAAIFSRALFFLWQNRTRLESPSFETEKEAHAN